MAVKSGGGGQLQSEPDCDHQMLRCGYRLCRHPPLCRSCVHRPLALWFPFNWFVTALMTVITSSCLLWWSNHRGCQGGAPPPPPPGARRTSWCECMRASCTPVDLQHRAEQPELYFCASSQRSDCLVKSVMVKVNKQWLGYCVADWKGNYFVVEAERCACVLFLESVCVEAQPRAPFFPLRVSLGSESSSWPVSVSQPTGLWNDPPQGSPGALQPLSAVPLTLLLPNYVFILFFHLHFFPALYSLTTPQSLTLFSLSHRQNRLLSLFSPET